jgi:ribokinase
LPTSPSAGRGSPRRETIFGSTKLGPGGKGSNQSVAAARVGRRRCLEARADDFARIAGAWAREGIAAVAEVADQPTGAACRRRGHRRQRDHRRGRRSRHDRPGDVDAVAAIPRCGVRAARQPAAAAQRPDRSRGGRVTVLNPARCPR